MDMYKKIKKQNGEQFAQAIRAHHNGIFDIPELDKILHHAGRDAEPLLHYLTSLLINNNMLEVETEPEDPFVLLDRAGYAAFYAGTLEKQNSIKKYFAKGELLCTFNDNSRYQKYHIVHAVKKDVDKIKREDFKGKERREDEYGTSVISIQMLKTGGFISIKNRYNHKVANCDNTFGSNPDNIVKGLSKSLKEHFNVDFKADSRLPGDFILVDRQIFKYHQETDGFYCGDNAWVKDGKITIVNKSKGDALFGHFFFDNKSKTLRLLGVSLDSFADDFNRDYGGRKGLMVKNGNLTLDGKILIVTENSAIKTIDLPELTEMSDYCLYVAPSLTEFKANNLTKMGKDCLICTTNLIKFETPNLIEMGNGCLFDTTVIELKMSKLVKMGRNCFRWAPNINTFEAPNIITMGANCLRDTPKSKIYAPKLNNKHNRPTIKYTPK